MTRKFKEKLWWSLSLLCLAFKRKKMKKQKKRSVKKGFTLVELLIVVVIFPLIFLTVFVAFSSFSQTLHESQRTVALTNSSRSGIQKLTWLVRTANDISFLEEENQHGIQIVRVNELDEKTYEKLVFDSVDNALKCTLDEIDSEGNVTGEMTYTVLHDVSGLSFQYQPFERTLYVKNLKFLQNKKTQRRRNFHGNGPGDPLEGVGGRKGFIPQKLAPERKLLFFRH